MNIRLHKNATTTPRIRALIQTSHEPMTVLARRFGVSVETITRWKHRGSVEDRSHTAHRLQTTLTPAQEAIVVYLRRALLLSLDDLLAVTREFLCPAVSRSGLNRCLYRHGGGNLPPAPARPVCPNSRSGTAGLVQIKSGTVSSENEQSAGT